MISGFTLTLSRANGTCRLVLYFTRRPVKRASSRSGARKDSIAPASPARNRFSPSPATSTEPRRESASARARSVEANASGASMGVKW